jgi:tetratricopeptide (TPR) repeat protein
VQRLAARGLLRLRDKRLEPNGTVELSDSLLSEQLADIEAVLARNSHDIGCWVAKGMILNEMMEYESALGCFDHALELDPNDAAAWFNRGYLLSDLRRHEEALSSYDQALKLDPNNDGAWNNRGVKLQEMGRYAEALASYDRAVKLDPLDDWARNNRSLLPRYVEDGFLDAIGQNKLEDAHSIWSVLHTITDLEDDKQILRRCILFAAELGHLSFARELIGEAALQEEFFPLDRALEYLQSEDEALIEKLSPETKEAVQVVVSDLRASLQQKAKSNVHPFSRVKLSIDDDYIAKRGHLVHKLKAKDSTGRWAYYFVLVPEFMEQTFLDILASEKSIDLEDYGRVIASCYGEAPNEEVKSLLKKKYGFSV